MKERFEELISRQNEGILTETERQELRSLLAQSGALRQLAAHDRILDRLLREWQQPPLDAQRILEALPRVPNELSTKTMAEVAERSLRTLSWTDWLASLLRERFAAFALTGSLAILVLAAWMIADAQCPPPQIGRFVAVVGSPAVRHFRSASSAVPRVSSAVRPGDVIETGDSGKAEIQFNDGTTLRLNFNTSMEIPQEGRRMAMLRPAEIELRSGELWSKVQKLTNAPRFAVHTPAATAVAKGTQFGLKLRKAPTSRSRAQANPNAGVEAILTVQEGAVQFSNSFGTVEAEAMTASTASATSAPTAPARANTSQMFLVGSGNTLEIGVGGGALEIFGSLLRFVYPFGWPGFEVDDGFPDKLPRIGSIYPGSPAAQAGLEIGDIITQLNGQVVTNFEQAQLPLLREPNARFDITVSRAGIPRTTTLTTTKNPDARVLPQLAPDLESTLFKNTWEAFEAAGHGPVSWQKWSSKKSEFETMLQRFGEQPAIYNNLAVWEEVKSDAAQSEIAHLTQAIQLEPDNPVYHYNLALVLRDIANLERSVEELEIARQLDPGWFPALMELGWTYQFLGRTDEAISAYDEATVLRPRSVGLLSRKVFSLMTLGRLDDALAGALKEVELEPSLGSYLNLGSVYMAREEPDLQEKAALKALELNPNSAAAYESLAQVAIMRAARLGEKSVEQDPWIAPPDQVSLSRWQNRDPEELKLIGQGEDYFRRQIKLQPNSGGAYVNLANVCLARGDFAGAEENFKVAEKLDPLTIPKNKNDRAYTLATWRMRLDDALSLAQEAVAEEPGNYGFIDTLSFVHFIRGELNQAEQGLHKCLEPMTSARYRAVVWFHLGVAYEAEKNIEGAKAAYEKALENQSDLKRAKEALERLRR